jgi:flagellin-like hook-associated protein FlgL
MWPKMLLDLAPHLVRLVPAANRFLQDKSASDEANREAMEQMAAGLRGDIGQVTASHAGIYRQLNEQSEKLERVAADVAVARMSAESTEGRMVRMQRRVGTMMKLLVASLVMSFVLLLVVFALLFKH